ncbi:MAG: LytTR family DNA-binding domain-containing protein [Oscillospiraceae bacterium]
MLKIIICDDEQSSLENTKKFIQTWAIKKNIMTKLFSFNNGQALLEKLKIINPDIIFLDIMMPNLNGINTAKEVRDKNKNVKIIFITASPEFALDSYSVKANGYCLKPIDQKRISEILEDFEQEYNENFKFIMVKTDYCYKKINYNQIEYIEAQNKKVGFFLDSGEKFEAIEPFRVFEEILLKEFCFFKCHRSYIVYIPNVDHFNSFEIKTKSGVTIPISRSHAKAFQEAYFSIMFKD